MDVLVRIPDVLAQRLMSQAGGDLERRALEALVLEEFRAGRLSKPELRRALGFEIGAEVDAFLKQHGIFDDYTADDVERERLALDRLGI